MEPKSRLVIQQLVTENFKSYAGTQTIGPFHKSFSAIVGPNGSGKSNVIDALLFVFGKRAKQIRLNKVSELIHKSDEYSGFAFAKVDVHFAEIVDQGEQDSHVVPGSDFIVSREAYADNSSKYKVDGRKKTRSEVEQLLASKGIDLENNRFLILQGEVEQIATMKPKGQTEHETGFLEYLEDVIGSNHYVDEIVKTGSTVETLNEERALKLNRVKAVEAERENLEGAKSEAEEFLKKQLQLCQQKKVLLMLDCADCAADRESLGAQILAIEEELEKTRESLPASIRQLESFEETCAAENREHSEIAAELARCKAEFAAYERKDVKFREDMKHGKEKQKVLKETIKKENSKVSKLSASAEANLSLLERNELEFVELTKASQVEERKLSEVYDSLKGETEALRKALESKKMELAPHKNTLDQLQSQLDVVEAERQMLVATQHSGTKQLKAAEAAIAAILEKERELQNSLVTANSEQTETDQSMGMLRHEQQNVETEVSQIEENLRALRLRVQESRLATEEVQAQGSVLQSLLSAKRDTLRGIEDRLGNLGSIDPKYDVAISTACAGPLNNIVCSDTSTAENAVDFLKKHNLGRATFIMLDKLNYLLPNMKALDTPENAPRLFDLVQVKEKKYLPAFYMAMRDTLVASDLEQATRLAYGSGKRWRVVTLEGQLIEASGTMAGGGKQVARGGMKASLTDTVSTQAMVAMEADLSALSDRHRAMRSRASSIASELKVLQKRSAAVGLSITKKRMEAHALANQRKDQEQRIPDLQQLANAMPSDADASKLSELDEMLEDARTSLADASNPVKRLEAEVTQLQYKIANVGGKRLATQKASFEAASAKVDEASSAVTKCKVQCKTIASNKAKSERLAARAEEHLAEAIIQTEKTRSDFKVLEEEAFKVMEQYNNAQSLLDAKTARVQHIRIEYEGLKEQVASARATEVDLTNNLEDLTKSVRESRSREAACDISLNALNHKISLLVAENPEMGSEFSFDILSEELCAYDRENVKQEVGRLEEVAATLAPNMGAIVEYRKREREYMERVAELDLLTSERDGARKEYEDLRKKRLDEFMNGFNKITMKLKEMYQMVTLGGDAELELVDTLDPFSEGIVFSVRPPKKSWKNISNLSGGEKTLSSLALVFALHHFKPTPLYFMDEIDAALDFKNVSIVAHYIKERTRNAQFIIISLRNNMFELADRLVGIYKTHNATKSVTIDPGTFSLTPRQQEHWRASAS